MSIRNSKTHIYERLRNGSRLKNGKDGVKGFLARYARLGAIADACGIEEE
jgi:hypothetical protein